MYIKKLYRNILSIIAALSVVSCNFMKNDTNSTNTGKLDKSKIELHLNPKAEKVAVIAQLKKYQQLYLQKSSQDISQLMGLFSSDTNIEVIYGCAEKPNTIGWCRGFGQVKNMMIKDSECWNRIDLNFNDTLVDFENNTAWVSTMGVAELTPDYLKKFKKFTANLKKSIEDEKQFNDAIAPTVLKIMVDILYLKNKAGKLELPFVLTIVYLKEEGKWLIRQMHFSYPIDPRGLDEISEIQLI